jgi:hypothetical protein
MGQDCVSFGFDQPGISFNFPVEPSPVNPACRIPFADLNAPLSEGDRIPVRLSDEPISSVANLVRPPDELVVESEHNRPAIVPVPLGTNGLPESVVSSSRDICFSL